VVDQRLQPCNTNKAAKLAAGIEDADGGREIARSAKRRRSAEALAKEAVPRSRAFDGTL
jgi:hypothetical protein